MGVFLRMEKRKERRTRRTLLSSPCELALTSQGLSAEVSSWPCQSPEIAMGTLLGETFHISQLQVSDPFVALPSPRDNHLSFFFFLGVEREEKE